MKLSLIYMILLILIWANVVSGLLMGRRLDGNHTYTINEDQLTHIVSEEWNLIKQQCTINKKAHVSVQFDDRLIGTGILGWGSQTDILINNTLYPSIVIPEHNGIDMLIGINPSPVNGWYTGTTCNTTNQYDLRTVIRHELLHGMGLTTSVFSIDIGRNYNGTCYLRLYDTLIKDAFGNRMVENCSIVNTAKKWYVNGIQVYNNSWSHHVYTNHLMFWELAPGKCQYLKAEEVRMLQAVGVTCTLDQYSLSSAHRSHFSLWLLPIFLLLL